MNNPTAALHGDTGSFRDANNRVYSIDERIIRGVSPKASEHWAALSQEKFFLRAMERGDVVKSQELPNTDAASLAAKAEGWASAIEHERIPFISYPYEWPISMLKDAAILKLKLIERALKNGWTLKDATAYNIQFIGTKPVFIDTVSYEPRENNEPWIGYRQFCMMFLIPLMLRAHLRLDHLPMLRANLEGIEPAEAAKIFRIGNFWKRGVLPHVLLPTMIENNIAKKERDDAVAKKRAVNQDTETVLALVQSMRRTVESLKFGINHTTWSHYEKTHTYDDVEFSKKTDFVERNAKTARWNIAWDLGCNTGTFSKLIAPYAKTVIAADGDHNAVEQLYLREKEQDAVGNILPLALNLANLSPNQGWGGCERKAFDDRTKPDFVMCLALIHHIAISANIPIPSFLDWLRSLDAKIIIEFVTREDDMVKKLLLNKTIEHADYNLPVFETEIEKRFTVLDSAPLKNGHRKIFFLAPK